MADSKKTKVRLLEELEAVKTRLAELEADEAERRRTASALEDSRLRYRILYEENPSMYFTVDAEGTILALNPFGASQLGYSVDELIGRPVLDVFYEADKNEVAAQLRTCVANPGKAFNWEFRKIRKNGAMMWVREVARAVQDDGGRIVVMVVCEDISDHKAVELELVESRERYRTLYTRTPVMLHSIDRDNRLLDVSDYWLDVLGYDRDEVIGCKVTDFMTPESKKFAEISSLPEFHRSGELREVPYRFIKKDGEIIDVLLSAIAETDRDGGFVRSLGVLTDVTERQRAVEALQRSHDEMEQRVKERTAELESQRRFLRQVIDVDPNFIFAKDRHGRFTLVNQAVAEAYGTTVKGLIGKTDADFNPNEDEVESFRRIDLDVMDKRQERFIREELITDSTGRRRWLQTVKRPLVDESGQASQVLGSATDITARKEAEEKLRASESELRRSHTELRLLAGRLLTAQEDERRRLAREMHDDLTQRLAALSMQARRLESRLRGQEGEMAAQMSSQLRDLSAGVHAMSRRLHPAILEDLGLVEGMRAECDGLKDRDELNAEFEATDVPSEVPKAVALCLYRIAQEALRNVAKHAGVREARVRLRGEPERLVLTIEDLGAGFDVNRDPAGRGLGLASMAERARLIEAEFSVNSKPGRGTVVRVAAPLMRLPGQRTA